MSPTTSEDGHQEEIGFFDTVPAWLSWPAMMCAAIFAVTLIRILQIAAYYLFIEPNAALWTGIAR